MKWRTTNGNSWLYCFGKAVLISTLLHTLALTVIGYTLYTDLRQHTYLHTGTKTATVSYVNNVLAV